MILEPNGKYFRLDDDTIIIGDKHTIVKGFGSKGGAQGEGECVEIYFRPNELFAWRPDDCKI